MITCQSKTSFMASCACDMPFSAIRQGDLLFKLVQVAKNGQVCDKETEGIDKQPSCGRHCCKKDEDLAS